jgi:peptidoglycan/LPS O-acetylase OafA/YrhL
MQRAHLPYEYAYLSNFFPPTRTDLVMLWGWSLALEEQFYLVVPLLFFGLLFLKRDWAKVVLLAVMWSGGLVTRLVIFYTHKGPWGDHELYGTLYFHTHTRFDTLVAGILLAVVHQRWGPSIGAWLSHPFHRALIAIPSLACLWLLLTPWLFGHDKVQVVHVYLWGSVTSVMYFLWGLLILNGDGWIHRALSAPFFRRLATLGYGVYLVHIPLCDRIVLPMARKLVGQKVSMVLVWPLSVATLMTASLTVAYALHVLVEKPSLWVRDKVAG